MGYFNGFLVLTVTLFVIQGCQCDERELFNALLTDYNKYVRPIKNTTASLTVKFEKTLLEIEDLDVTTQTLTLHGWLRMTWPDEYLAWDPKEHDNIAKIHVPVDRIWKPDIMLYNSRSGMSLWDSTADTLALVYSDGTVLWIPPAKLAVGCALDMRDFPYDKHDCQLKFGSWTYDASKVNVTWMSDSSEMGIDHYKDHQEWELESSSGSRNEMVYACCPEKYVDITYDITLARRSHYYEHTVVAPSLALMFLTPAVFLLPPDSGEKIHLGAGILVAQTLLLASMERAVQTTTPTIPRFTVHFVANIVLVAISLFMSSIIVGVWAKSNRNAMLPNIVRTVVLGILGRLVCVQRDTFMPVEQANGVNMRRLDIVTDGSGEEGGAGGFSAADDKQYMMQTYARLTTLSEWRQLAAILDRLLFVLYVFIAFCVLFVKY